MKSSSKFDIVVYGATGFTGQLVAEYFAGPLWWPERAEMGDGRTQPRQARSGPRRDRRADRRRLDQGRCQRSSVVVSDDEQAGSVIPTVGPYQLYGSELVALAPASGTDYLDLCGEPVWMRQMIDAHEAAARSSARGILFSCGFDLLRRARRVLLRGDR